MSFDMNPADEDPHGECRSEIHRLTKESDILRGMMSKVMPCHYCGVDEIAKCPHGFPGCALADDITVFDESANKECRELRSQIAELNAQVSDYQILCGMCDLGVLYRQENGTLTDIDKMQRAIIWKEGEACDLRAEIDSLKERVAVANEMRDNAENQAKAKVQAEMSKLRTMAGNISILRDRLKQPSMQAEWVAEKVLEWMDELGM